MEPGTELRVEQTWDGAPVGPDEAASVTLVERDGGLHVVVSAPSHDDPVPTAPPGPTWALWEHEVVELFVLGAEDRYTEMEVGPHGHFLVLRLEGQRNVVDRLLPVVVTCARGEGRWTADLHLPRHLLPPRPWRLNAYAIHGLGAARRYLAWAAVPGPAPDFHRLECFREVPGIGA